MVDYPKERTKLCEVCLWADAAKQYQCRMWPRDHEKATGLQRAIWHWLRGNGGQRCPGWKVRPFDK